MTDNKMISTSLVTNLSDEISISEGIANGKIIEGVLYFRDIKTRTINTKLPLTWFEYQLAHSVVALIKVVVNKLDESHREYLRSSLKFMSDAYDKGIDPTDSNNMITLPNDALFLRNINEKDKASRIN